VLARRKRREGALTVAMGREGLKEWRAEGTRVAEDEEESDSDGEEERTTRVLLWRMRR
jgi:hypothetical protein